MSGKLTLAFGVAVAAVTWWYVQPGATKSRRPLGKAEILNAVEDQARHTFKVSGPLTVRLEIDGAPPAEVGDVYRVVGFVSSSQLVSDATLLWIVPRNAEVVSGQVRQSISLIPDQETRVELTLKAKTPGAQRVQLRASARQGGTRFAASGRYTNKPMPRDFTNKRDTLNPSAVDSVEEERKIFQ